MSADRSRALCDWAVATLRRTQVWVAIIDTIACFVLTVYLVYIGGSLLRSYSRADEVALGHKPVRI